MPIVPDTRDWTWVLERPCPECDFGSRAFPEEQVGRMVRDNAAATEDRYDEQDPAEVAGDLAAAASRLADRFDGVRDTDWQRTANGSDGARFTVETFARYTIHDPVHRLDDLAKGFAVLDAGRRG